MASYEEELKAVEDGTYSGDLLKVRTAGGRWAKLRLTMLNSGRSHPRLRAKQILTKITGQLRPDLASMNNALKDYTSFTGQLQTLGQQSTSWVATGVQGKISELFAAAGQADSGLEALRAALETVVKQKEVEAKEKSAVKRSAKAKQLSVVQPFLDNQVPPVWANAFHAIGVAPGSDGDGKLLPVENYEACESPVTDDYKQWDQPAWFQLDSAPEGCRGIATITERIVFVWNSYEQVVSQCVLVLTINN